MMPPAVYHGIDLVSDFCNEHQLHHRIKLFEGSALPAKGC